MSWKVLGMGRSFDNEDMERELEKAYKEGYREGMEEAEERYGERSGRGGYSNGSYGERMWDDDEYGERRGVKGTGPYAGEYRRRRR